GIVNVFKIPHSVWSWAGKFGGPRIRARLRGVARAGNGDGDGVEHQNPAQRKLRHRGVWKERADLFDRCETDFIGHAREGFADVESFPFAVELAMVRSLELGVRPEFSRQKTARQRPPRDDGGLLAFGEIIKNLGRALSENIEDDLDAPHARKFDGLDRLLDALDA